jgi:hypothetical protein
MKSIIPKLLVWLILTSITCIINAQSSYKIQGIILDSANHLSPIDFASIGIIGKNVGTVSNDSGIFHLSIPNENLHDSLTFSRIGFYSKNMNIGWLLKQNNVKIILVPKPIQIDDVQININKLKSKTLGNITRSHSIVGSITSDTSSLGQEFGTVFHLPNSQVFIKDFNFHIYYNRPDSAKLRLNIYKYNNKGIGKNLLKENIYFEITTKNSGDYKLDLSKYKIHASNDIFITVENVAVYTSHGPNPNIKYDKYSYNKILISCALLGSKGFIRKVSMGKWEKIHYGGSPGFWITYFE